MIYVQTLETFSFEGMGEITVNNLDNNVFYCDFMVIGSCALTSKMDNFTMNMNGVGSINAKALIDNIVDAT